ncbi:MAG: hypothetical protein AAB966_03070 [Patescibacteria group bacterium]
MGGIICLLLEIFGGSLTIVRTESDSAKEPLFLEGTMIVFVLPFREFDTGTSTLKSDL